MTHIPDTCIACGGTPVSTVWNGIDILRCETCGLAWRALFDITEDHYEQQHEREPEPGADKITARIRNARDRLNTIRPFLPQEDIVDIGCGDGSFVKVLIDAGYRDSWGLELDRTLVNYAVTKGLDVIQGAVADLSRHTAEKRVKATTLFHVIEHLADPRTTLKMLFHVLPPGGILIIETPDIDAPLQKTTHYMNDLVYPEHLFYWNEHALRTVLDHEGFDTLLVAHRSFDWSRVPIRDSLLRFGLRLGVRRSIATIPFTPPSNNQLSATKTKRSVLRHMLGTCLAHTIHLLGKDDYLLIVATKRP